MVDDSLIYFEISFDLSVPRSFLLAVPHPCPLYPISALYSLPLLSVPHLCSLWQSGDDQGMARSTYVTMSLMLGQLTHKPETVEGYILTSGWLFSCFILAASFTAELASFLTAERQSSVVSVAASEELCMDAFGMSPCLALVSR